MVDQKRSLGSYQQLLLLLLVAPLFLPAQTKLAQPYQGEGLDSLTTTLDSATYAFGYFYMEEFSKLNLPIDVSYFTGGFVGGQGDIDPEIFAIAQTIEDFHRLVVERKGDPFTIDDPYPYASDLLSFSIGAQLGHQMKDQEMMLSAAALFQGSLDQQTETRSKVGEKIAEQVELLQQLIFERMKARMAVVAIEEKAKGEIFLAEKALAEGVYKTESGLYYEVLEAGFGASPGPDSRVKTHYEGFLIDGTKFDSSVDRGEPITFQLQQVIAGWLEGVQLMEEGAKYRFYIPPHLAYGDDGVPESIPPGATIIFEVELIEIVE